MGPRCGKPADLRPVLERRARVRAFLREHPEQTSFGALRLGQLLGVSSYTLRRWAAAGVLPGTWVGERLRVHRDDVVEFAEWGGPTSTSGRAANILRISPTTLQKSRVEGRISAELTSRGWVYTRESIKAYATTHGRGRRGRARAKR